MSSHDDPEGIQNGAEIIQRFGGIRPMAGKTDIPVTTIQGWKKRDTIPFARRDEVLKAATEHDIDLSDLIPDSEGGSFDTDRADKDRATVHIETARQESSDPENMDNSFSNMVQSAKEAREVNAPHELADEADTHYNENNETVRHQYSERSANPSSANTPFKSTGKETGDQGANKETDEKNGRDYVTMEQLNTKLAEMRKQTLVRAYWVSGGIAVLILAIAATLLWPQAEQVKTTAERNNDRLVSLEKDVSALDQEVDEMQGKRGSFFKGLVPENIDKKIEELGAKTGEIQGRVSDLAGQTQQLAGEIIGQDGSSLNERLARLESKFQEFSGSETFATMLGRIQEYKTAFNGQEQLDSIMGQLGEVVKRTQETNIGFEKALADIQGEDTALGKALEGVENDNLKAAAMLLAFTQVRQSLGRDKKSFEEDLKILESMVKEDNEELKSALSQLAPRAKEGVLTPGGLSKQLRGLSGEIVSASLKGEDISFKEKAQARMNEVLSVKKDGELVTGTQTQKKVEKAQKLLDEGKIEEAVAELKSLEEGSQKAAKPVIDEAQATLLAQKVQSMLGNNIIQRLAGGNLNAGSIGNSLQNLGQNLGQNGLNGMGANGMGSSLNNPDVDGKQMLKNLKKELYKATSPNVSIDEESGYAILPRN